LIRENGCFGCHEIAGWKSGNRIGPDMRLEPSTPLEDLHPIERNRVINDPDNRPGNLRKVGPALSRISEKTTQQWIEKWLYSPSSFRPDTKMPHYYNLSTNNVEALKRDDAQLKEGELKQAQFPNTEIASIAYFLTRNSKDYLTTAEGLRQLDAKNAGARTEDEARLVDLLNRGRLSEDEQKELANVKTRIKLRREAKLTDPAPGHKGDVKNGKKLFIERGCLACHSHQGTEDQVTGEAIFGPSLTQVPEKLGKSQEARNWLIQWILNPQAHNPRTRMPQTHLSPTEAADVAAWLLNQQPAEMGKDWNDIKIEAPTRKELEELARVPVAHAVKKRHRAVLQGPVAAGPSANP
jgi:cbb3-type cytochrome oxidase cytochrome c subunit